MPTVRLSVRTWDGWEAVTVEYGRTSSRLRVRVETASGRKIWVPGWFGFNDIPTRARTAQGWKPAAWFATGDSTRFSIIDAWIEWLGEWGPITPRETLAGWPTYGPVPNVLGPINNVPLIPDFYRTDIPPFSAGDAVWANHWNGAKSFGHGFVRFKPLLTGDVDTFDPDMWLGMALVDLTPIQHYPYTYGEDLGGVDVTIREVRLVWSLGASLSTEVGPDLTGYKETVTSSGFAWTLYRLDPAGMPRLIAPAQYPGGTPLPPHPVWMVGEYMTGLFSPEPNNNDDSTTGRRTPPPTGDWTVTGEVATWTVDTNITLVETFTPAELDATGWLAGYGLATNHRLPTPGIPQIPSESNAATQVIASGQAYLTRVEFEYGIDFT